MQFSIITPSFRNSEWLRLCIPSVADQGVSLEHIVQDAGSDDGTLDWLPQDRRVRAYVEKDQGMYDAVNRGLRRAQGEILAYLNCDEQYLPGALPAVWDFFQRHPDIEIAYADTLIVNGDGSFNCFRKVLMPWESHTRVSHLCTFTCSTFFRRSVIERHQLFFDHRYRDVGDCDWVIRARRQRIPSKVFRHYTTVFTETGDNMNLRPNAAREKRELASQAPGWVQTARPLIEMVHRLRRLANGAYWEKPFSYEIYTQANPAQRTCFHVARPTALWRRPAAQPVRAANNRATERGAD